MPANPTISDGGPVTLTGTAGTAPHDSSTVRVVFHDRDGLVTYQATVPVVDGRWQASFTGPMAENAYWVAAYQTDEAGNSGRSVSLDYVVSRTNPVTRITTAPRSHDNRDVPRRDQVLGRQERRHLPLLARRSRVRRVRQPPRLPVRAVRRRARMRSRSTPPTPPGASNSPPARMAWRDDSHGPKLTREQPVDGSWTTDSTPTLSGAAGDDYGDAATISVSVQRTDRPGQVLRRTVTRDGKRWSIDLPELVDGHYWVGVQQTDDIDRVTEVDTEQGFDVITHPPDTTVTDKDGAAYRIGSHDFGFASPDHAVGFECRVDDDAWAACASPRGVNVGALREGDHTFAARAMGVDGSADATPAIVRFTVDMTPPALAVDSPSEGAHFSSADFSGHSPPAAGDGRVLVSLSTAAGSYYNSRSVAPVDGAWTVSLGTPPVGDYTATITQSDAAGNVARVVRHLHSDGPPPRTEISGYYALIQSRSASFWFKGGAGYECRIDAGGWEACPDGQKNYYGLVDGTHTVRGASDQRDRRARPVPGVPFVADRHDAARARRRPARRLDHRGPAAASQRHRGHRRGRPKLADRPDRAGQRRPDR